MVNGDLLILFIANIIAFIIYAIDKWQATRNKWRIPELILLLLAFLGGAFGALCAMILFQHKTQKIVFKICIPLFLYIQLTIDILYRLSIFNL